MAITASVTLTIVGCALVRAADPAGAAVAYKHGSAPIGSTRYPVPSHAVVVSRSGHDSAAGTLAHPFKTLTHAIAVAPSGSTIVMRAGVYHPEVTIPSNRTLTIQAYPGAAVWLDGSRPVYHWQHLGSIWVHTGWKAKFISTPAYSTSQGSWVNSSYPMAAHPDQVFVNGKQLKQVGSLGEVVGGSFFVDYRTNQLYLGSNPAKHHVRASDLATAITVHSPNTLLRGFGVRRYATPVPLMGTVSLDGAHDQIANVVITNNASQGLHLGAANARVDHVSVTTNGLLGIHGNYADGVVIQNSLVRDNNSQHFDTSPTAGGIKLTRSRGITVRHCSVNSNIGNGIWFDTSSYNMTVVDNLLYNNKRAGLSIELSALAVIADNKTSGNLFDGIRITDTSNVKIWNNALAGNKSRNLEVVQDLRRNTPSAPGHDPRRPNPDPTISWITENVQIMNNLFIGGGQFHVYVFDQTGKRVANQMNVSVDGDMFTPPPRQGFAEFGWGTANKTITRYTTLQAFTAATGDGTHNTLSHGSNRHQIRLDANHRSASAIPLSKSVAAALGCPVGTRHLGPF